MHYEMVHRYVRDLSCKLKIYVSWSTSEFSVRLVPLNMFKPSSIIYWPFQDGASFMDPFLILMFRVCLCHTLRPCNVLCVLCSCVYVTFPYGVPGQVWYLIVSIPDLCLPLCFHQQPAYLI